MDSGIFNVNIDPKLSTQIQSNQMPSLGWNVLFLGFCVSVFISDIRLLLWWKFKITSNSLQQSTTIKCSNQLTSLDIVLFEYLYGNITSIPCRLLHRTPFQRFMWCNGISRCHCNKCDGYFMDFLLLSNSNEIIVCARVKVISCFRSIKFLITNKQVVMSSHAYTIHSHSFDSMKSWSIKYSVMDCIDFFMICFVVQRNIEVS